MSFFMRSMHGSNKRQPKRILNENKNRKIDGYRVEEWERGIEKSIECWYTIWKYISENMNQKAFFAAYLSLSKYNYYPLISINSIQSFETTEIRGVQNNQRNWVIFYR